MPGRWISVGSKVVMGISPLEELGEATGSSLPLSLLAKSDSHNQLRGHHFQEALPRESLPSIIVQSCYTR